MPLPRALRPSDRIDPVALERGLHAFAADGVCSQVMSTLIGGAFLTAFAMALGASNTVIGLIAAIGPLSQLVQIPTVALLARTRARKAVAFLTALPSRVAWLGIAAIPWLLPAPLQVPTLLLLLVVSGVLGTVSSAAWNPWMRDFIPEERMGALFGRRMSLAMLTSAVLSIVAGLAIDALQGVLPRSSEAYSFIFAIGVLAGIAGLVFLARIPEPLMPDAEPRPLVDIVREPLLNPGFRQLMIFLAAWAWASGLASPFFTVYLLRRLQFPMTWVIGFSVLSQLVNARFLRLWGPLADRFSNKAVLGVAGGLFLLHLGLWPFTGLFDRRWMTVALVGVIHVLGGIASAGITLCSGNIALKTSPRGEAAAFLATNALVTGVVSSVAPVLAGISADWFATQRVSITIDWTSTLGHGQRVALSALDLQGLDFLFLLAVLFGFYALHRLLSVPETGVAEEAEVVAALREEIRRSARNVGAAVQQTVFSDGLRVIVGFPFAIATRLLPERRRRRRASRERAPAPVGDAGG